MSFPRRRESSTAGVNGPGFPTGLTAVGNDTADGALSRSGIGGTSLPMTVTGFRALACTVMGRPIPIRKALRFARSRFKAGVKTFAGVIPAKAGIQNRWRERPLDSRPA